MDSENRALLAILVPIVAVAGVGGGYFLLAPSAPSTLIVPAGTVFQLPSPGAEVHFNVTAPGGILVGAWTSTSSTCALLFPFGMSIPRAIFEQCLAQATLSGTFHTDLTSPAPGTEYVLGFLSDSPATVWITQDIQVVY